MAIPISIVPENNADAVTGSPEQQQDAIDAANQPAIDLDEVVVTAAADRSSISRFMAKNRFGFAKSNRFIVEVYTPNGLYGGVPGITERLTFLCESAEFPGRELTTSDTRIYGPTYKSPTLSAYNDITLTFLCDNQLFVKTFFDNWVNYINPISNFNFQFRENYVSEIIIRHYDEVNTSTYAMKLWEAYPVSVAPLQANWGDDNIHRLQVTMTYRYWEQVGTPPNRTIDEYEESRLQHEFRIQDESFKSGYGSPVTDPAAHRRRIQRTLENSTNNFKKVISDITSG